MKTTSLFAVLLVAAALTTIASVAQADATTATAVGRWLTESGNFEIDIAPCGAVLCGKVARVLANRSMSRSEAKEPAVKGAVGMTILSDLRPAGEGEWRGQIFNSENGKTYDCQITLPAPGRLEVRAYKFLPLLGKTQIWKRVPVQH